MQQQVTANTAWSAALQAACKPPSLVGITVKRAAFAGCQQHLQQCVQRATLVSAQFVTAPGVPPSSSPACCPVLDAV
eukprot:12228501-Alexandrium_andersonii.AAC.1